MRVLVTGGSGFLGSRLVERLTREGHDVAIARRADHDLTSMGATARLFEETAPELVFHLAAEVGGIGANRANPGRYWYANLIMGAHVLEQARLHETPKLVIAGTICAYPKFAPVPFHEDDLWNGYPEETNAPYGVAKKTILVGAQAYREQYGTNAIFLLPVNLYGPGDNFDLETSHVIPALIRKMVEAHDRGDAGDRALGGRHADARVPVRRRLRRGSRARRGALRRTPSPSTSAPAEEIAIGDLAELVRDATGFEGAIRWDTSKPNGQPRRRLDTSRAEELFGFRAAVPLRDGLTRTVAWYRETRKREHRGDGDPPDQTLAALVPHRRRGDPSRRRRTRGVIGFQILATVALFFSVNRNGWLTYQGGDQIWLVTSGWLLGKGMIGYALTGHGWPMLLAPLTWITGSSSVQLLPLTTAFQVGVLAPIATLAVYDIGARLAGRLAGSGARRRSRSRRSSQFPTSSSATTTRGSISSCRRRSG